MPTERFQFTGEGGHQLSAALELPDGEPGAFALFAHCFTCGKDTLAAKRISVALAAKGIAVLRFDFTGLGSSEGDFANSTFSSNVADLVRAADHLRSTREAPTILIGHSLGGAAMVATARASGQCCAAASTAAPPRLWPIRIAGARYISRKWLAAATRSATFDVKWVLANSPSLAPSPVKSKRSTAMPRVASATEMRLAASVSLPQVKQCANSA